MTHFKILLSNVIVKAALTASIFLWALTATLYAASKNSTTVLIGIDENGTRVIDGAEDPLLKTEVVSFIRHFCLLLYNFDQRSFVENVGSASELMSADLWTQLERPLKDKKQIVEEKNISHSGLVDQIIEIDDTTYEVVIRGFEQRNLKREERLFKLSLRLKKLTRTNLNPWGIEVDEIKELPLN